MTKHKNIKWLPENSTLTTASIEEAVHLEKGKTTSAFCFIFDGPDIVLLEHANKKRGFDIPGLRTV